jgi:hypothetical protein
MWDTLLMGGKKSWARSGGKPIKSLSSKVYLVVLSLKFIEGFWQRFDGVVVNLSVQSRSFLINSHFILRNWHELWVVKLCRQMASDEFQFFFGIISRTRRMTIAWKWINLNQAGKMFTWFRHKFSAWKLNFHYGYRLSQQKALLHFPFACSDAIIV